MIELDKLSERGYSGVAGKLMSDKLSSVNQMFSEGIRKWLDTGNETEYEISGIKLSDLKIKFNLTYPAAILSMDWLLREPENAKQSFLKGIR